METNKTPANPESEMPFRRRAWEFWRRNQILLLQLPIMVAFLFGSYIALKSLDSRIGVEGFGDLFGYLLNGVRAVLIVFTAWWIKRHCWFDLHQATELDLFERVRDKNDAAARWLIAKDRIEWAVALAFATWWFTR